MKLSAQEVQNELLLDFRIGYDDVVADESWDESWDDFDEFIDLYDAGLLIYFSSDYEEKLEQGLSLEEGKALKAFLSCSLC